MAKRQITIPGKRQLEDQSKIDDTIRIDLDDQSGDSGVPIDQALFESLVNTFVSEGRKLRKNEKQFYYIDAQLLRLLLSTQGCSGLLIGKCLKPNGDDYDESLAFIVVDKGCVPVNWQAKSVAKDSLTSDVAAVEWIHGKTSQEIQDSFLRKGDFRGNEIDFEKLFQSFNTEINTQ